MIPGHGQDMLKHVFVDFVNVHACGLKIIGGLLVIRYTTGLNN